MPRRKAPRTSEDPRPEPAPPPAPGWEPPVEVVRALAPWLDVRRVGPVGFYRWLRGALPALPAPGTDPSSPPDIEHRVAELGLALLDSAGASAAAHFRASELLRDNVLLARRVAVLEGALRSAGRAVPDGPRGAEERPGRYRPGSDGP